MLAGVKRGKHGAGMQIGEPKIVPDTFSADTFSDDETTASRERINNQDFAEAFFLT
jgi:hypothetical protein